MAAQVAHGSRRRALGFALRFFAILFTVGALARLDLLVFEGAASRVLTQNAAGLVATSFSLLGQEVRQSGNQLYYGGAAFRIIDECTGIDVMVLLAAAMLAFPSSWRHRGVGLAIGLSTLVVLNLIRIMSLVWMGSLSHRALEYGHIYVWPIVVLTVALGLWLQWARGATRVADPLV